MQCIADAHLKSCHLPATRGANWQEEKTESSDLKQKQRAKNIEKTRMINLRRAV
jgi:hypothetical protein